MTALVSGQIVFLECRQTRLYAEVIQVLAARQIGWIRPLALVSGADIYPLGMAFEAGAAALNQTTPPDLLWPLGDLVPALDTDVMPLLTGLATKFLATEVAEAAPSGQPQLTVNEFVHQLWADRQGQAPD
ncbi:MAG: hypothetical protein EA368_11755 [Leptolyngbya sp. DLM2.Bin27]|nr:MAG: hypothetical protein EA368_11755 [Leptolyngbya sp. DLM2.Bin27]